MPTIAIKRYPNRKLYNTIDKQYITLEGIGELIQHGNDVQVIDHASGEDLTALTLSQVILEQEKKRVGFLPRAVLTGLIQAGGSTLDSVRRTLVSPLDLARHADEEIERRIGFLIERGEMSEAEGRLLTTRLINVREHSETAVTFDNAITRFLHQRGVPTRRDVEKLAKQLDALADSVAEIGGQQKR